VGSLCPPIHTSLPHYFGTSLFTSPQPSLDTWRSKGEYLSALRVPLFPRERRSHGHRSRPFLSLP
jgi:hypothetical protein